MGCNVTKRKPSGSSSHWQLSVRTAIEGERRGVTLEVYNPVLNIHEQFNIWHGTARRTGNRPPGEAVEIKANRFNKLLSEAGLQIPDARRRIAELLLAGSYVS